MSRGPVASRLVLLSDLPSRSIGEKVRFLGWYGYHVPSAPFPGNLRAVCYGKWLVLIENSVTSYSIASGTLCVGHLYPRDTNVTALVDVNLLLETLTSEITRIGEFVNIIGYVTSLRGPRKTKAEDHEPMRVSVQALLVWPTGPMDIQKYEKSLEAQ